MLDYANAHRTFKYYISVYDEDYKEWRRLDDFASLTEASKIAKEWRSFCEEKDYTAIRLDLWETKRSGDDFVMSFDVNGKPYQVTRVDTLP